MPLADTPIAGYCDLCSKIILTTDRPSEVLILGRVFKFCCASCEAVFLSKNISHLPAPVLPGLSLEGFNPALSWLDQAVQQEASDLFLSVGEPPTLKIYGVFKKLDDKLLDHRTLEEFIHALLPEDKRKSFDEGHDVDLGFEIKGVSRFRMNIFRHHKGLSLAVRPLPLQIPSMEALNLPEVFRDLTRLKHGLILVTGPAGSGKTTSLASFIDAINRAEEKHIVTIEDPIEYVIQNQRSLIHQREVGWHTTSFADGLRSALRENPDIIVVGELRDLESIALALRAAETGHLVLGTLHSGSAVQALTRIIDVFDSARQPQILTQLAQSLQCICSQRLIKRVDRPGMALASEMLMVTLAISNIIRQNRINEIRGYMETGQAENMHTFRQSTEKLTRAGLINKEETSDALEILDTKKL